MIIKNARKAKNYLTRMFKSAHNKISVGAERLARAMRWPRGEDWRGGGRRHDDKK